MLLIGNLPPAIDVGPPAPDRPAGRRGQAACRRGEGGRAVIRTPTPWLIYGSFVLGLVFALLPLAEPSAPPPLPAGDGACLLGDGSAAQRVGLTHGFVLGLTADLVASALLGEQALRLVVLAFIVQRFRARLRFFPLWQQALAIGVLLLNDRVVVALIHLVVGSPQSMDKLAGADAGHALVAVAVRAAGHGAAARTRAQLKRCARAGAT